jgi:hypothetical protein
MEINALKNSIAISVHQQLFWYTPYRTGNLARSIGDVWNLDNGCGFYIFNKNQRAAYGEILNEAPVIRYRITNNKTKKVYSGSYVNKHYKWIDNAFENIASNTACMFNLRYVRS